MWGDTGANLTVLNVPPWSLFEQRLREITRICFLDILQAKTSSRISARDDGWKRSLLVFF